MKKFFVIFFLLFSLHCRAFSVTRYGCNAIECVEKPLKRGYNEVCLKGKEIIIAFNNFLNSKWVKFSVSLVGFVVKTLFVLVICFFVGFIGGSVGGLFCANFVIKWEGTIAHRRALGVFYGASLSILLVLNPLAFVYGLKINADLVLSVLFTGIIGGFNALSFLNDLHIPSVSR